MSAVLDASALLAYLQDEPGGEAGRSGHRPRGHVHRELGRSRGKVRDDGVDTQGLLEDIASLGLAFVPFSAVQAETAGRLGERTGRHGLSLGDRACLALGLDRGETVYTADRVWLHLNLGVEVEAIR